MPLVDFVDGREREARVDPRDGNLKDTRDFAKDLKDFARESKDRRERMERDERDDREERVRDRIESEEHGYDREKNQAVIDQCLKEQNKSTFEKVSDKLFGSTKESCLNKQAALEKGGARVEKVTIAVCSAAIAQGGTNLPVNVGCGASLGTTIATDVACEVWKSHCDTLPSKNP